MAMSPTAASVRIASTRSISSVRFGRPGEVVVRRRPLQPLGRAPLLGDVLDVGDCKCNAFVLGDGDAGARPDELAVAAQVALVEQVRVGDAQLEPGPVGRRGAQVLGVGDLADGAPDEVVDGPVEHVGERAVGVEDRRVVEADERHAGRRRVERLLEAPPRLLERAHPLLALGDVAQADDGTPASALRGRSTVASTSVLVDPSACGRRTVTAAGARPPRPFASHWSRSVPAGRLDEGREAAGR